jgi:hypothetical protein
MPKGHPKGYTTGYQPRKSDPPELVARVRYLYEQRQMSQMEIASEFRWTLKKVQGVFRRNAIPTRPQIKRDQRGSKNARWKGDQAGYQALHLRVYAERGRPFPCSVCGTTTAKAYDWANLTGNYQAIEDFVPMCRSCHWKHDGKVSNLRQ